MRRLVETANQAGGRDNITVVAFRLEEADEVAAADDGATLVGPSAEEAGLSAERLRAAAARRERGRELEAAGRPSRWRTAAKVLAVLLLVAGLGVAAYFGARQVYFLGIDEGGRVSLYRGLPYDLPLGIELYSEVYSIPVQAVSVPEDRRESLTDHDLRSRDDAVSLLDSIEADAVTPAAPQTPAGQAGGGQRTAASLRAPAPAATMRARRAARSRAAARAAGRRRRRRRQRQLSARNRELLALAPVAVIVAAGFAAVFIVKDNEVSDVSLTYAGYFLALCLAAHIFLRIRLPYADPYLFPLCALLAAVGLVVIYRIDDGLAFDQASVFVLGLVLFCLTILLLRDYHVLERYRYVIASVGSSSCSGRSSPATRSTAPTSASTSVRSPSSRPSWRRSASSSSSPATWPRSARCSRSPPGGCSA